MSLKLLVDVTLLGEFHALMQGVLYQDMHGV